MAVIGEVIINPNFSHNYRLFVGRVTGVSLEKSGLKTEFPNRRPTRTRNWTEKEIERKTSFFGKISTMKEAALSY